MITWIHFDVKKFWSLGLYLIFSFLRFAVTYRRWKCICFSIFRGLQSLLDAKNVSAFLLFAICSHFSPPEVYPIFSFWQSAVTFHHQKCILFSPFSDLQSLWKPGSVSFFLFLAICGHFRIHECICILLFCNLRSLSGAGSVSYFLLLVICSHILTPEMYLHFSFSRFAVTYRRQKAMSKAWWVTKKRNKRRFSRLMLRGFFRQ